MAQFLPFVAQNMLNTPVMVSERHAAMIVAALSGRMNITAFEDGFGTMDGKALEDLAMLGRLEHDQRVAKAKQEIDPKAPGAQLVDLGDWTPYQLTPSGIAVIQVKGTLVRSWGVGPYSGCTGYDGIWVQLYHAWGNDKVKAIWLDINSGGGAVDGVFDLAQGIYENSARFGGKPIYGHAADYSASAAYLLLAACDVPTMPVLGQVGSIGCLVMHAEYSQQLVEEGITVTIIRDPDGKARGNSVEPLDDATRKKIFDSVREVNLAFVEAVSTYRRVSKKVVSETNAALYSGKQALATGLVKELLSEQQAWTNLELKVARM